MLRIYTSDVVMRRMREASVPGMAVPLTRSEVMMMRSPASSPSLAGKLRPGDRPSSSSGSKATGSLLGSPRQRYTPGASAVAMLQGTSASGSSKTVQAMRMEHREDHITSDMKLLKFESGEIDHTALCHLTTGRRTVLISNCAAQSFTVGGWVTRKNHMHSNN